MATIKEIAEKSGYSRGTVDRVINNRGHVDKETKRRIQAVIDEAGYKPNPSAQMLSHSKKEHRIGAVVQSRDNPFFSSLIEGLENGARLYKEYGLSITITEVKGFGEEANLKAVQNAVKMESDALLVNVPDESSIADYLEKLEIPFATLNSDLSAEKTLFYSGSDYVKKGRMHASLLTLVSKDEPHILLLQGSNRMKGHGEVISSFISELEKNRFPFTVEGIFQNNDRNEETVRIIEREVMKNPKINTVFISTSGIGSLENLELNKDLLIFTSDDTEEVKSLLEKEIVKWTISQNPYMQGKEGVTRMFKYLINKEKPENYLANLVIKTKANMED